MTPEPPRDERRKGIVAILAVTLLWSLNFVAAHPAAVAFEPFLLTCLRSTSAALVFTAVLAARRRLGVVRPAALLAALPLALACILCNQVLFLLAIRTTTPAHVALVIATVPVFVAILARLFLREHLAPLRVVGIAVAFAGVALLALDRGGAARLRPTLRGDLMAVVAALAFAAFTVANKRLVARVGAFEATALVYLSGTLLLLPLALPSIVTGGLAGHGAAEWASAGYLVVAATLLAYPLFAYALARLTASRVAVFTYLQPILATLLSVSLGWERLPPRTVAGAALALAGVGLAQRRARLTRCPSCGSSCSGCCG